jgi:hypothetical protein
MPMKTLTEIRQAREEAALMAKIAAVEETLGDDPRVVELFDHACDLVKEAGVDNAEEIVDIATQIVIDTLSTSETPAEEVEEATEKVAESEDASAYEVGKHVAQIAHAAGITREELEKVASADEARKLGFALGAVAMKLAAEEPEAEE